MRSKTYTIHRGALLFAVILSATACSSHYMMTSRAPTVLAPSAGDATVVFLRPSRFGGSAKVHLAADTVGYLGTLAGEQKVVAKVPAGSHLFFSWSENTDVVMAELAPGKVYYLLVGMRMGAWSARHSLSRYTSDRAEWTRFEDDNGSTTEMTRKPGEAGRGPSPEVLATKEAEARRAWAGLEATAKMLRTLAPKDGQTP